MIGLPSRSLLALLCGTVLLVACSESTEIESNLILRADENTAPVKFVVGNGEYVRSHFLSRWFGLSDNHFDNQDPPTVISDLRDGIKVSTPSRFSINLTDIEVPFNLRSAVRRLQHGTTQIDSNLHCEIFVREGDKLDSLIALTFKAQKSPSLWQPINCTVPAPGSSGAKRTLEFVSRWQTSALAAQEGPPVVWEVPVLSSLERNSKSDILLVTVDTFRSDALEYAPRLNSLLHKGAIWPRAVSPSTWTLPAYASLFTGQLPDQHGAGRGAFTGKIDQDSPRIFHGLSPQLPTLAESFANAGYATSLIHQNPFLEPWSGLDRGFQNYVRCSEDVAKTLKTAQARWEKLPSPRFMVLHLIGPHLPYDSITHLDEVEWSEFFNIEHSPSQRREFFDFTELQKSQIRKAYKQEVASMDALLGPWLEQWIENKKIGIFAFHADHGEELWDAGSFEHGHSFDDSVVRVPVALWTEDIEANSYPQAVGSHWLASSLLQISKLPKSETWGPDLFTQRGETRSLGSLYRTESGGRVFRVSTNESRSLPVADAISGSGPIAEPDPFLLEALQELGYYQ